MTEQKDNVHSSVPVRTPKSQLAAEQPSTGECWIPGYQKKIPISKGKGEATTRRENISIFVIFIKT